MKKRYKAAWWVRGEIKTGDSHLDILAQMTEEEKNSDVRHGYVDLAGRFHESIDELFESMRHLYIIRHAQTWYNVKKTCNLDSPLTPYGEQQADSLGRYMRDLDLSGYVGYVSPFLRTLQTARAVARNTGVEFRVLPGIAEFGALASWSSAAGCPEGYHVEVPRRGSMFPEFNWNGFDKREFTSETKEEFRERMKHVLENSLPERTVIVTHGAVVWTLIDLLTEGRMLKSGFESVTNASVSFVEGHEPVYLFKNVMGEDR